MAWDTTKVTGDIISSADYNCVDKDTEILTKRGWLYYTELIEENQVLTFNIQKNIMEWSKINEIVYYKVIEENMILIETNQISQLLTKNHKVLSKNSYDNDWKFRYAENIKKQTNFPVSSNFESEPIFSDDWLRLIAWVITEGNYTKNSNAVEISQTDKYYNHIIDILNRLDIKYYSSFKKGLGYIYINANDGILIRKCLYYGKTKLTPELKNLNSYQAKLFIHELICGDGSYRNENNTSFTYYSNDEELIDNIQELCIKCNIRALKSLPYYNKMFMHCKPIFHLHCVETNNVSNRLTEIKNIKYSGIIWCVNTNNHTFVARRKGKPFITGNSGVTDQKTRAIRTTGAGVPSSAPANIGDMYIDTSNNKFYISMGTSGAGDWKKVISQ